MDCIYFDNKRAIIRILELFYYLISSLVGKIICCIQMHKVRFSLRYRSKLGAVYLIIAVEALPWDWSFFLSYFNQYLSHYVNTKQPS